MTAGLNGVNYLFLPDAARRTQLENRSVWVAAASQGRTVEIACRIHDETGLWIFAVRPASEVINDRFSPACSGAAELVYDALFVHATATRRSIEVSHAVEYHGTNRTSTIGTSGEAIEYGFVPSGGGVVR
jgi:hypothetical protein